MPKINYQCEICLNEVSIIYRNINDIKEHINCDFKFCSGLMLKTMNVPLPHTEFDKADTYRNKHVLKNINAVMKERSRKYQKENDIGIQIEKHGKETMMNTSFFNDDGSLKTVFDEK